MSDDAAELHRRQMAYVAEMTGAFAAPRKDPEEPVTGVRKKAPPRPSKPGQDAPTRPDLPKPQPPPESAPPPKGGAANGVPAGALGSWTANAEQVRLSAVGGGGGGGPRFEPDAPPKSVVVPVEPGKTYDVTIGEKGKPTTFDEAVKEVIDELGGPFTPENIRGLITCECRELECLLHDKNAGYGNSVLDPVRVFSKASPIEQLYVRIDDKLSRVMRGDFTKTPDEKLRDTVRDLQGYLILLQVAWRLGLR